MKKQNGFNAGWTESSIGVILRSRSELAHRFGYILVTSVDSSTELTKLPEAQAIIQRYTGAQFLGEGLLLPSSQISEVSSTLKLFTGFDEIWCFDDAPSLAKPDDVSLVAPLNVATDAIPARVVQWMQESRCRLGLGDGIGLNFVTPDDTLAELVQRIAVT